MSILTYGLGAGIIGNERAKDILQNITNQNRGHLTLIEDGSKEELNSALGSYYQFFVTASGLYIHFHFSFSADFDHHHF